MLLQVHVDDQIFGLQRRGGISRYFLELVREFRSDPELNVDVVTRRLWTINDGLVDAGWGRRLPTSLGGRRRVLRAANRLRAVRSADIVHHTYYDRAYLRRRARVGLRVTTVHDMIPELFPDLFLEGNPHEGKREFVEASDLVLCVSEATRKDVLDVYGPVRAAVRVTPLGVDHRFCEPAARPGAAPDRYVLCVGNRGGYKDFPVLAEAFSRAELPGDMRLLAVGGGPFNDDEELLLGRLGLGSRARQVTLTDSEMPGVYAHAAAFVFPSRYEGFGLPTLEAMAAGCPAILAATSSHLEVGGDAATYFEPGDVSGLARCLETLAADGTHRENVVVRGRHRAAAFTWSETARRTADAYKACLGDPVGS